MPASKTKAPNIWQRHVSTYDDATSTLSVSRFIFMGAYEGEAITGNKNFTIKGVSTLDVADIVASVIDDPRISSQSWDSIVVTGQFKGKPVFASVYNHARNEYDAKPTDSATITVSVTGARDCHKPIFDMVDKKVGRTKAAKVQWWYIESNRTQSQEIFLPPLKTVLRPEFYPDLPDPQGFLEEYLGSDASILLLAGPPGTGKTTLLRHLIQENNLNAFVVYDDKVMDKDSVFQNFLFGDADILIIEDADAVLCSREKDDNRLMARFLNVSDGLIKLPNKKVVFTTNISDFGKVDEALTRPGRCFGLMHTRHLNLKEAQAAASVAGLAIPAERKEYTIADLFNQDRKVTPRRIGFVA